MYDTIYGIYNQLDNPSPLSSVALHPAESLDSDYYFKNILMEYIGNSVNEYYHLSLTEYMDIPAHYRRQLNSISGIKMKEKEVMAQKIKADLDGRKR